MLYIPRGLVHEAATTEAVPSMHLTITADTEDRMAMGGRVIADLHRHDCAQSQL